MQHKERTLELNKGSLKMKQILTLVIFIRIVAMGQAQEKNFIDQPYIETLTNVDTLVSPDRIYLKIILSERDTKGIVLSFGSYSINFCQMR